MSPREADPPSVQGASIDHESDARPRIIDTGRAVAQPAAALVPDAGRPHYRSVLHVGDSLVGYRAGLQLELGRMFRAEGTRYESRTFTAAGLRSFATDKHMRKLVAE